ncbi:MAG: hypothetical protein PHH00_04375 [Candidatus Nanoarchaeia archaeon]|nr:hypothetical protein [Candidatus Nanoarchaeia archaeon]
MGIKETKNLFAFISKNLTVETIAKPIKENQEDCPIIKKDLPVFDSLDLLEKHPCLKIEGDLEVTRAQMMKKPIRALFFILSTEIEYSLYKTLKNYDKSEKDLKELQSSFLNDLIRKFLKLDEPFKLQSTYKTISEIKKDLKAFSSFRNIIMHSNTKIQLETDFKIILERKKQMLKLFEAFEQIREHLKSGTN